MELKTNKTMLGNSSAEDQNAFSKYEKWPKSATAIAAFVIGSVHDVYLPSVPASILTWAYIRLMFFLKPVYMRPVFLLFLSSDLLILTLFCGFVLDFGLLFPRLSK